MPKQKCSCPCLREIEILRKQNANYQREFLKTLHDLTKAQARIRFLEKNSGGRTNAVKRLAQEVLPF
jgi:phage tail tape-measure protein